MSKFFKATTENGDCDFEITDDNKIILICDDGLKCDVTAFTLIMSEFSDPEKALIDLYTDQGDENVSIVEVAK